MNNMNIIRICIALGSLVGNVLANSDVSPSPTDLVQSKITETMAQARQIVNEHGISEASMRQIEAALGRLGKVPGLLASADFRELHHGSGGAAAVLATEGDEGLTLILARFKPDAPTPVHDHGTWGVAYVVEGRDHYTEWERVDNGSDPQHAELRVKSEKVLNAGDSVYWLGPPHDIHSQQGKDGVASELVLFGRNAMRTTRHYFNPKTGQVTEAKPQ
jgi:predicted metal-dependent enzyme (double-stranded beta helix superfamily)